MQKIRETASTMKNVPVIVTPVRETFVDIDARDLVPAAAGMDFVIIRVCGLSGPNRPTSRTLRIPTRMLEEPTRIEDWN